MNYRIDHKGNTIMIHAEAGTDKIAEKMCKNLISVVRSMNRFKPEATNEYNGAEFDVEYESYPEVIGESETGKTLYSVTKIGIAGLLLEEEAAQALNKNIFEILSDKLTEYKNNS